MAYFAGYFSTAMFYLGYERISNIPRATKHAPLPERSVISEIRYHNCELGSDGFDRQTGRASLIRVVAIYHLASMIMVAELSVMNCFKICSDMLPVSVS